MKHILFILPFVFKKEQMTEEILVGPLYVENFIKKRIRDVKTDILDFICEEKLRNFDLNHVEPEDKFHNQMDRLISSIDFELNKNSIIGISCPTSKHYIPLMMIAKYFQLNYPEIPNVVGGAHATSVPNDFIFDETPIDYIFLGEGELNFLNLINNGFKKEKLPKIYPNNPILNLDDLPVVDFTLYEKYNKLFKTISIALSRGCPFNCSFCMEKKLIEAGNVHKTWRSYSPKRAMNEFNSALDFGKQNGIESFGFYDPIFGFSRKWLLEFLDLYPKDPDWHIWTECRLDVLSEDVIIKLKKRKISLMYGLESYSKEMLQIMDKTKNPTKYLKKFDEIINISEKLDMFCVINIIINHPGETRKAFNETYEFTKMISEKINFVNLNFNLYRHFPGTPLYSNMDYYKKKYGSEFYFLEWWKSKDLLEFGPSAIRASDDLPLRELLKLYRESYTTLEKLNLQNLKRLKNKMEDYFLKVMYEKNRMNFIQNFVDKNMRNFLDKYKIEI